MENTLIDILGTAIGLGWGSCGIAGWLLMGGGAALGTWRGALLLGPFALLLAILKSKR
jgi:hypothetical protein